MANIFKKRLEKLYKWNGKGFSDLMSDILSINFDNIQEHIAFAVDDHFKKYVPKARKEFRTFMLPKIDKEFLKREIYIKKAKERGIEMSNNLRDRLTDNLHTIMKDPKYVTARGKFSGQLKKDIFKDFENEIKATFEGYTKVDPTIGIPTNIHSIARTEVRSAASRIKGEYVGKMMTDNDLIVEKTWIHAGSRLFKNYVPRPHHKKLDGITIKFDEDFKIGDYMAPYPHHESLPVGEKANCSCEIKYRMRKADKTVKKSIVSNDLSRVTKDDVIKQLTAYIDKYI